MFGCFSHRTGEFWHVKLVESGNGGTNTVSMVKSAVGHCAILLIYNNYNNNYLGIELLYWFQDRAGVCVCLVWFSFSITVSFQVYYCLTCKSPVLLFSIS